MKFHRIYSVPLNLGRHINKIEALWSENSRGLLVRVERFERSAPWTQTCVGTFKRHSIALFGPFRRSGNSSLTLFCPACFKQNFLLLGWVWDWILYIKRCSARVEGQWQAGSPQWRGAGIASHKQRIKPPPAVWAQPVSSQINGCLPKVISILPCRRTKDNRGLHRAIK